MRRQKTVKKFAYALALIVALFAATVHAQASETQQSERPTGEMMGNTCAACHGTHGRLGSAAFVPLAGMAAEEFVRAMRAFRDGSRPSTLMHSVAVGFSDEEYQAMAEFFAAQRIEE
ncbi:cytochrome c class I [Thioalkalivibrio sulfidiphilus HL-EbGr7]|uniref:Cytochrome c class I n=1 Tax=Thioalkalivibrio sulfidiphilus (strain HL-EbGR7) TaxID=396588 RepID=B8GME5_THISH|nr:cytochrome c class I [Thioalkalivibrio sulfidiphilus HL-EbGr7]